MHVFESLLGQRSVPIPDDLPVQLPQIAQIESLGRDHFFDLRVVLVAFSVLAQLLGSRVWYDLAFRTNDDGNLFVKQTWQNVVLIFEESAILFAGDLVLFL